MRLTRILFVLVHVSLPIIDLSFQLYLLHLAAVSIDCKLELIEVSMEICAICVGQYFDKKYN